jgi:hypothetical protein
MPSCVARSSISCGPSLRPASIMKYSDRVLDGTAANSLYKSSNRPLFIILSARPTLLRCRLTCVSLSMGVSLGHPRCKWPRGSGALTTRRSKPMGPAPDPQQSMHSCFCEREILVVGFDGYLPAPTLRGSVARQLVCFGLCPAPLWRRIHKCGARPI